MALRLRSTAVSAVHSQVARGSSRGDDLFIGCYQVVWQAYDYILLHMIQYSLLLFEFGCKIFFPAGPSSLFCSLLGWAMTAD
jgi:hypothetical protein